MESKSFYRNASMNAHIAVVIASCLMIGFSIYLTSHYFELKFPTGLSSSGLCNINSFFNCDTTTNSPLSNIAGVPISLFGILMGLFPLAGYLFKSDEYEGTVYSLLVLNGLGCLILFLYSLIVLGGLCPFCTLYYIASLFTAYMFYKNSTLCKPSIVPLAVTGAIALAGAGFTYNYVQGKTQEIDQFAQSLINQYESLKNLGAPTIESPYRIASAAKVFTDAPIQITKFSDFECPACKMLSDVLTQVKNKYKGKVNIQYFFYPLDNTCNPNMQRALHRNACHAAYLASCLPEKFSQVEHDIFANQQSLSTEWITDYAKKENVLDCYNDQKTKNLISRYITEAAKFNVKSTPTFLLNGVKIEGVLPLKQISILIDHLLRK